MALSIRINSKLEIYNLEGIKIGDTKVQDMDSNFIHMGIPYKEGKQIPMAPGKRFKAIYYDKDNKLFEFESEIVDRKKDGIVLYKIKKPTRMFPVQRRRSVRIPIILEVEYMELGKGEKDIFKFDIKEEDMKKAFSVDLSASGTGLIVKEEIPQNQEILLSLKLDGKEIDLLGKSVRIEKQERRGEVQIKIGVQFENLKYATEEELTNFIFTEMRKQIKKGN